MLVIGIGHSRLRLSQAAAREAIGRARDMLGQARPGAALVFAGIGHDHGLILNAIAGAYPGVPVIGCTSAWEMSSEAGFAADSVLLTVFGGEGVHFAGALASGIQASPRSAVEAAVAALGALPPRGVCLAFPDGISLNATDVLPRLADALGPDWPVLGGASSMPLDVAAAPLQFFAAGVHTDSMPLLCIGGDFAAAFGVSHSFRPAGRKTKVTKASGFAIERVGHRAALDFYRYYLGPHTVPAVEFPLAVIEPGQGYSIRTPAGCDEAAGTVSFFAPIREGATVQLAEAIPAKMTGGIKSTVAKAAKDYPAQAGPAFALVFSCVTRGLILGTRTASELEIVRAALPEGTPVAGFYTFSEIAPLAAGATSISHNTTLTALLLGERGDRQHHASQPRDDAPGSSGPAERAKPPEAAEPREPADDPEILRVMLRRSEAARARLEIAKDVDAAMTRRINQEIIEAKRELTRLNRDLAREKKKSDDLLRNILPAAVAEELKATGAVEPVHYPSASVLFGDFAGFTRIASTMTSAEVVRELDYYFTAFDAIAERHGLEKLKTIGDAYMCACGLPDKRADHAAAIVAGALAMQRFMAGAKSEGHPFDLRLGVHCGPLTAGVVGRRKFAYDIWGDTVNVASRLESAGEPGKVNVSRDVYELIKDRFACTPRGEIEVKNRGKVEMFFVEAR